MKKKTPIIQYYVPSGKFEGLGLIIQLAAAAAAACILSLPYALTEWYCPVIYLGIFLPWIYARLSVRLSKFSIVRAKNRSPQMAGLMGLLGMLPGIYLSWAAWAVLAENISAPGTMNLGWRTVATAESSLHLTQLMTMAASPLDILQNIQAISARGLWSIEQAHINGPLLYLIWTAETFIILFFAYRSSARYIGRPFSERKNRYLPQYNLREPVSLPAKADSGALFR
ncbi:MAG: hypothetical protein LBK52_03620, partial [Deltaproteobacteria bacterium]|nr:hypothetical protein [Deltaproteobacteria bacterium]